MKLVQFSATNYRSITSAHRIKFSNVTVLIGRNNEGKSNLLRALETAMLLLKQHALTSQTRNRRTYVSNSAYLWQRDFPIQLQERRSATQTILKLEFLLDEDECRQFKDEIGSSFNGSLPLEIKIGKDQEPHFRLVKSGKNTTALTTKSAQIARFVANRIAFNYIPAIRTDNTTIELISGLLSQELRALESDERYIEALNTISTLQQPILDDLATRVHGPLKEFLPSINSVKLEISESSRRYSLRRDVNVVIDDGTPTLLEYKGDGVKSLAALGLLKNQNAPTGASILAIEEPESHLHPAAIHQVNEIIHSISETSQVILTTHNPLFVDRENIKANVIVTDGGATPAKNISSIRDTLGIKASDNLTHANYALVVEGEEDAISLRSLLPLLSDKIAKALRNNMLIIEPIGGAGNLSYKLSLLRNSLCAVHILLDGDQAGREAYNKAEKDSLISVANCTFINCNGMKEAEFEDCINLDTYYDVILNEQGVDLKSTKFRGNEKWSQRMRNVFLDQGKPFTDELLMKSKYHVASAITKNPKNSLNEHKRNSIDAMVKSLERMIKS
ncbi:AAA family ATPase [Aeromonas veronii]|uniref:AAA family ATPase n=1 Tax=Aeromonas veronii TaxID=654 RepID=UPI003A39E208